MSLYNYVRQNFIFSFTNTLSFIQNSRPIKYNNEETLICVFGLQITMMDSKFCWVYILIFYNYIIEIVIDVDFFLCTYTLVSRKLSIGSFKLV